MRNLLNRCPAWMLLPIYERDYRRLVVWSYVLVARARALECAVAMAAPFATVGLVAALRRHTDALSADIATFKRRVRERHRAMGVGAVATRIETPPNPWV